MINDIKLIDNVIPAREDYIREESYECWLFNPQWLVMPSIAFVKNKGPLILTCRDHNKGSNLFMIHPCRQPLHILPPKDSDQLAHAVIQSRLIKPLKSSAFSNQFQMHEQRGTFNGLDSFGLTNWRKFNLTSKLLAEAEARSLANRPDTNSLLTQLVNEHVIGESIANSRRIEAIDMTRNIDFYPFHRSATYVPLDIAMSFQRDTMEKEIEAVLDDREDDEPDVIRKFKKCWPTHIYPCQTNDIFGARFASIPKFFAKSNNEIQEADVIMTWTVSALMTRIDKLWQLVTECDLRRSRWHGWLLVHLTAKCFKNMARKQDTKDPFKKIQVSTIARLVSKISNAGDALINVFADLDRVKCSNDLDDIEVDDNHDIVILDDYLHTDRQELLLSFHVGEFEYELCVVLCTFPMRNNKWDGFVYSRHSGHGELSHMGWWYQGRNDSIPKQSNLPRTVFSAERRYVLAYVRVQTPDTTSMKSEFLTYLGGQKHIHCSLHRIPLIASTERKLKCNCGKTEFYRCCTLNCQCCICKHCVNQHDRDVITLIDNNGTPSDGTHNDDDENLIDPHPASNTEDDFDDFMNGHENEVRDELIDENQEEENLIELENFDDFVTRTDDPDMEEDEEEFDFTPIPSTDAGEIAVTINEEVPVKAIHVSGHVLLNQCGSLLTRKTHQINGSSKHKYFLQKICSTSIGKSIPLLYPEGMIFPSIHWSMANDNCSVLGAIPAPLLSDAISKYGFASIPQHVRNRITTAAAATGSDPRYIAYSYDTLTNLAANHCDTRIMLNRGLTAAKDESGGLGLRGKGDSGLLESIDSKQMVKNLCASQKYHSMDYFLTFTCNQKKHFGTSPIKNWVDSEAWIPFFPDYDQIPTSDRKEIKEAVLQASGVLLLRNWQEVCKLFIDYLRKSPSSPYKSVLSIFARNEYQKEVGNLSHIHLMLQIYWRLLNESQTAFVKDLIRASVLEIVRTSEVQTLLDEGIFKSMDDYQDMMKDARKFLPHICNPRCLARVGPDQYRCRKLNNLKVTTDNTKHVFKDLPNNFSHECVNRLIKCGLAQPLCINADDFQAPVNYLIPFFKPKRHIPPTNPSDDMNMSPVEGKTFSVCRSMQNAQQLTECGGVNKYVCKYIGKIDENNYVVVNVDGKGQLVTKAVFLHNTKVVTSKIHEDQAREKSRDNSHMQGRAISQMEMLHVMLKYPEVYSNLNFIQISTMPLELRAGIEVNNKNDNVEDGAHIGSLSNHIRHEKDLPSWRQHTANELMLFEGLKSSNISIDKISKFSLRPPELRFLFDSIGDYYRWFEFTPKRLNGEILDEELKTNLNETIWVDCLLQQVKVRRKAFPEIMKYLAEIEGDDNDEEDEERSHAITAMSIIFHEIHSVCENRRENLNEAQIIFLIHVETNLMVDNEDEDHLPVPVFSYIKPTMGVQFLLHIMLSMGRFATEIDLTLHGSLRESLRYAKLIGPSDTPENLEEYSNQLLSRFIDEQLIYFPNSQRVVDSWIITAGELFDSVIIDDEIPISDMPPVQLTALFADIEESKDSYKTTIKSNIIDAALKELSETAIEKCNIPLKQDIMNATKDLPYRWDAVTNYTQGDTQPDSSFNEQKLAIELCTRAIDSYTAVSHIFTKSAGIGGFPGSGKTWSMEYCVIYALCQGLCVVTTAQMARRAIQLGGKHWHYLFCLPTEKGLSAHRKAELSITKILRDPKKLNFILSLDILFCDELGQSTAELISVIDIILRKLRDNNIFLGGVLIIFTMDHTQILPFESRPFLTSTHVIPCFRMVALETSIRANGDELFQRAQAIARYSYRKLTREPQLVDEFIGLVSENFTFVEDWSSELITPSTYRLYGKKVPAKEAAKQFVERVRRSIDGINLREKSSEDVEKSRFSHREWCTASIHTSNQLEQLVKEPNLVLFFRGAKYEFTYNDEGKFSQSQMVLLYDLPSQNDLDTWKKIKVLAAPPGIKDIEFNEDDTKQSFIDKGFIEVKVGVAPDRTRLLKSNIQAKRKQYGLRHCVTSTIHAAMGDTLISMATEISLNDPQFRLWDKGQLVVILSRTKRAKNTIFVGSKEDTLATLKNILLKRTQWCDYMDRVLDLITINSPRMQEEGREEAWRGRVMSQETFPFRTCDISLPQCRTGFVYFLIAVRKRSYSYIGQTICIRRRIKEHNSGYGSQSTTPSYLRPFALMAYICGFNGERSELRLHMERQWKLKRDYMIRMGNNDPRDWARAGQDVIDTVVNDHQFNVDASDLRLVCLFRDIE